MPEPCQCNGGASHHTTQQVSQEHVLGWSDCLTSVRCSEQFVRPKLIQCCPLTTISDQTLKTEGNMMTFIENTMKNKNLMTGLVRVGKASHCSATVLVACK